MAGDNKELTPTFIVHLNGQRFSAEQEADVKRITIKEAVDEPSAFEITMSDSIRKWTDFDGFTVGSGIKIQLGYKDAVGELMNGEITVMTPLFQKNADDSVILGGNNYLHRTDGGKKTRPFTNKSDQDIVKQIATEAGLKASADKMGPKHKFIIQKDITDYDYVMLIASKYGYKVWSKDKTIYVKKEKESNDNVVLEYGKTLMEFFPQLNSRGILTEVNIKGWDTQNNKAIAGKATLANINKKIGGDQLGGAIVKKNISESKTILIDEEIKDKKTADSIALEMITNNSMNYITAKGLVQGNIKLRPGMEVEIKELGTKFSGAYFIKNVTHRFISNEGYTTMIQVAKNAT